MFWNQVRFQTLLWRTHSLMFWGSCCPLFLWPFTSVWFYQRQCKVSMCCSQKSVLSQQTRVGNACVSCRSWEKLLPRSDFSFWGCSSQLGSTPLWLSQLMGMDTLTWDCFAAPQQSAPLDYCCFCMCVKPAMVLPHWDAAETKCNWRCLERGLLGESRAVLVNPACRWHVHKLTSLTAGGSCINFLSALTD